MTDGGDTVPWLAACGPLAYSPEQPPASDYFFQYTWILPGIFAPRVNLKQHFYFGAQHRGQAQEVFAFWKAARARAIARVACRLGYRSPGGITAPIAAYRHEDRLGRRRFVLLQHGSYLFIDDADQPLLDQGDVLVYRGIGQARVFRWPSDVSVPLLHRYLQAHAAALVDSVVSFTSIHDRAVRCETGHIRDRSRISDEIATRCGLRLDRKGPDRTLWQAALQSFSLSQHLAKWKFGPHYVVGRTPLGNIRITTFFAGEDEVRLVDPTRIDWIEAVGCRVARSSVRPVG